MILVPLQTLADDEDVSRERKVRGRHVSKRDIIIVTIVLVAVIAVSIPFIGPQIERANDTDCRENMKAIGQAIALYVAQNDDRLPATHNVDLTDGSAATPPNGYPITWASNIQPFLGPRRSFLCRSASPEEAVNTTSGKPGQKSFPLSYGMYKGLSTVPTIQIPDPNNSILVAETSDQGSKGTYDPHPFGPNKPNGFLIGWDDSNSEFTKLSKWATRLAFHGNGTGYEGQNVTGRHNDHINSVTVSGAYRSLHAPDARIEHSSPRLKGLWWADPNLYR